MLNFRQWAEPYRAASKKKLPNGLYEGLPGYHFHAFCRVEIALGDQNILHVDRVKAIEIGGLDIKAAIKKFSLTYEAPCGADLEILEWQPDEVLDKFCRVPDDLEAKWREEFATWIRESGVQ